MRQVRRALTLQVGQEEESVGSRRHTGDFGIHAGVVPTEEIAEGLGGHRDIHGAEKRHPVVGAVAERSDLALWIDNRLRGAGENGPAGSEAGCHNARAGVCRADGGHHVVASPAAYNNLRRKPPLRGQLGQERSHWLERGANRREHFYQAGIDGIADLPAPGAGADIH